MIYGPAEEKSRRQFTGYLVKLVNDAPTLTDALRQSQRATSESELAVYQSRLYRKLLFRFLFFSRCLWNTPESAKIYRELHRAETVFGPYFYLLHFGFTDALTYSAISRTPPDVVMQRQRAMGGDDPPGEGYAARLSAFDAACESVWFARPLASAVAAAARGDAAAKAIADLGAGIPGRRRRQRDPGAAPAPTKPRKPKRRRTKRLPDSARR